MGALEDHVIDFAVKGNMHSLSLLEGAAKNREYKNIEPEIKNGGRVMIIHIRKPLIVSGVKVTGRAKVKLALERLMSRAFTLKVKAPDVQGAAPQWLKRRTVRGRSRAAS